MVTFLNICEKIDRVIAAPHCICAQPEGSWIPERNRLGSSGGPRVHILHQKSTALDTICERVTNLSRKVNNLSVFYCILEEYIYIALISAGKRLTHWDRVTHICISKLTIIGSDNDLSPGRRQAIIWTNAGILLNRPLGTIFNEFSIEIHTFSLKKIHLKLSSGTWRPFCLGLNVLKLLCPNTAIMRNFSFLDGGYASHHLFTNHFIAAVISKRLSLKFLWTKAVFRPTFIQNIYIILLLRVIESIGITVIRVCRA